MFFSNWLVSAKRLEIYVIDPIFFIVEKYLDIPTTTQEVTNGYIFLISKNINLKFEEAIRENSAFINEAKHIVVITLNSPIRVHSGHNAH